MSQVLPILVMSLLAETRSLLLYEQPEVHLHPAVQSRLGDFFLGVIATGKQCVVETHSEHLVTRLRLRAAQDTDRNVAEDVLTYFVDRPAGGSRYRALAMNEYGVFPEWPKGFFDEAEENATAIVRSSLEKRKRRVKARPDA
jgi:predicted ATPase